ncbi:unnamed protein product [Rotaria sordida]|uniref:Uncharacterized protein n=1 Tax=Rotaria sordida TaxID=392033 RepID=A0A814PSN3_9BILA|nr:unnamed protein product [Rotaria sordida]
MYSIMDVMTQNNRNDENDSRHLNNRLHHSMFQEYHSGKTDDNRLVDNIYLYIGVVVVILIILSGIIMMIKKCIKNYKKKDQLEQNIQSNALLSGLLITRKHSSV